MEDVTEFKKSVKGSENQNKRAANREMPDFSIIDKVRESGINEALKEYEPGWGTTVIRTKEQARKAIKILESVPNRIHAWDTETLHINVKEESPVGHGQIICAQCFAGPDLDFGNGPRLFIDNYADSSDLIMVFQEYFENEKYLKVWHNYGFDRHIFFNHGINVKGFGGDTMHMARLADPSRMRYSLKHLTWNMQVPIQNIKAAII